MRYGDKKARYAVLDYNGNLREVVGAVFGSSKVEYTKPDSLVEVKNNGTSNSITIIDTGSDGSYIIKNSNKSVDNWGWTNGTAEVTIPSNATIWTHGQHSDHDHNIVTGNNGQFEVVDWNNCTGKELDQGFNQAKAIKIVPNSWPKSITTLYKTLARITLDNIPNWNNAAPVTDIRELFNGTVINGDLKIDGMIANLTNATKVNKLLNNLVINNYLNSPDEYKFYYLYKMLSNNVSGTNSAACFGGYQYSSGNYNPSYNYAVKFKFTDVNGQTANVIPPDLMYIPKEWGGFLDDTYGYVDVVSFTDSSLKVNADRHIAWTLASNYYTIKQSDGNWIVENFRDFYSSCYCAAEIDYDYNGQHYHYAYVFRRNNHEVTFSSLIPQVECTIKLHMYMALPDSTTSPRIVDGQINTDYQEVFMELDDPHRGEDGVYTVVMTPEETGYDITTCTITIDTCSQGDSNITWKVYDADNKRIDNGIRPPEKYIVTLSNDTNTYTYGTNTLITSASIPLYNIADGICIDESGVVVVNIPDGDYTINVKAYKDENYCETTSPITIKNWVDFRTGVDIIPDMDAAAEGIFKWTVNKDGESVMNSYNNADFWTWKYDTATSTWVGYDTGYTNPTNGNIIDLSGDNHPNGRYKISMRVRSKLDQWSVYPPKVNDEFFVWEVTKTSEATYTEITMKSNIGALALAVYIPETITIHGFYWWSVNMNNLVGTNPSAFYIAKQTDTSSTETKTLQTKASIVNTQYAGFENTSLVTTDGNMIQKAIFNIENGLLLEPGYYLFAGEFVRDWQIAQSPMIKCSDDSKYKRGIIYDVSTWAKNNTIDAMWQPNGSIVNKGTEVIFETF